MSDLHKLFLKRVKQQEQAFGLLLLSEDSETTAFAAPVRSRSRFERTDANHHSIFEKYKKEKHHTFPISTVYSNPKTGLLFQIYYKPPASKTTSIFILCHGAGSSSMTYCKLAQSLSKVDSQESYGVLAFDMRGHGNSSASDDFSLGSLTKDFAFILDKFHEEHKPESSLYLVGHSLGGAVFTNYLHTNPDNDYNIKGLVMLDIVEETAVTSLTAMPAFLDKLPKKFHTYKQAIDWHVKAAKLLKNESSAQVSVPDLFNDSEDTLTWKLDLKLTMPFWKAWFTGLSSNFVSCGSKQHVAKLLILAGHETLDTSLIIGQMQGKYQLIVFNNPEAGHFLQEDIPTNISSSLVDFSKRNDSPDEYMKKELGFVPKWGGKINS